MDCATIGQSVLHWVWPRICAHCREDLPKDYEGPLCNPCRLKLVSCEPPFCLRCAQPLRPPRTHCLACSTRLHACRMVRAAFLYRQAAVSLAHAFKYRGRRSAARAAGAWMGACLPRFPELGRPDYLVPMPLHPHRRRERGYNQALLIAEGLSESSGIPVRELLVRRRLTRPLWSLDREARRKNLEGAFEFSGPPAEAAGANLLLIDDVATSTASLEACARVLQQAGAAQACGYVFARQPAGGTAGL